MHKYERIALWVLVVGLISYIVFKGTLSKYTTGKNSIMDLDELSGLDPELKVLGRVHLKNIAGALTEKTNEQWKNMSKDEKIQFKQSLQDTSKTAVKNIKEPQPEPEPSTRVNDINSPPLTDQKDKTIKGKDIYAYSYTTPNYNTFMLLKVRATDDYVGQTVLTVTNNTGVSTVQATKFSELGNFSQDIFMLLPKTKVTLNARATSGAFMIDKFLITKELM